MEWIYSDEWTRRFLISNVSLSSAAKRVELINLSGPKRSFRRRDSADCKQRGTKWSAEGIERVPSQAAMHKKTLPPLVDFRVIFEF